MNRDHTVIEELLAVRSLGGLDGDDVARLERELASHGDCEECRRLANEFGETAGRLGFALEPIPVDPGQADEILHRANHPATQEVAPPPAAVPIDELGARRASAGRRWPVLAAAAAVVVLVVAAVTISSSLRSIDVQASTDQTVVGFTGDAGELAMAYQPGKPGALIVGSNLADPGSDKVYEIWMLQGHDGRERRLRATARRIDRRVRARRPRGHRSDGRDRRTRLLSLAADQRADPGQRSARRLARRANVPSDTDRMARPFRRWSPTIEVTAST